MALPTLEAPPPSVPAPPSPVTLIPPLTIPTPSVIQPIVGKILMSGRLLSRLPPPLVLLVPLLTTRSVRSPLLPVPHSHSAPRRWVPVHLARSICKPMLPLASIYLATATSASGPPLPPPS